jgi:inosine/xanthosine triphosphatase
MKIILGSLNPVKMQAVQEIFGAIPALHHAHFEQLKAASLVPDQPIGLEQIILGARNRAREAFASGDLGIGIESGLIPVPLTTNGYMNLTVCVIFDGEHWYTGLGPAFELPDDITSMVVEEGLELDKAVNRSGLSQDPRIGYGQGIIGIMTKGRVTRMEYSKPAISMALARMDV